MQAPKPYLITALVLVAAGSSFIAWKQQLELVELRGAALNSTERADLEQHIREIERENRALENRLAASRSSAESSAALDATERPAGAAQGGGRLGRGGMRPDTMRTLMDNPQMQALRALQQRGVLDERYSALFKNLQLPSETLEKFKTLLAERQATLMDVMAAAREQGIDPRANPDEFRKLVSAAQAEVDNSIKSLLGDPAYAQYQAHEQTAPQRNTVGQLEQRLSYTDAPLTPAQSEQLVKILASSSAASANNASGTTPAPQFGAAFSVRGPAGQNSGTGGATVTTEAITQAQSVLSAAQLGALQQLQQEQQAAQKLQNAMSETLRAQQQARATPSPRGGG